MSLPGQIEFQENLAFSTNHNFCPFRVAGCQFESQTIHGVQKHIKDDPIRHLALLCDAVHDLAYTARHLQMNVESYEMKLDYNLKRSLDMQNAAGGSHLLWKIDNYKEKFEAAKTGAKCTIFSPPFFVGRYGYKMVMLAALYGDGKARGKFMSVFVSIVQGEHDAILPWPFHHEIKLTLLDQCENPDERKHVKFAIKPNPRLENKSFLARPEKDRNASFGAQNFVELDVIKKFSFVKDDTIFLTCNVDTTDINNYI